MRYVAIRIPLEPASRDAVREILREGPPFDLEATPIERHVVFQLGDELVFVFEGVHSERTIDDLLAKAGVRDRLSRLASHFRGTPEIAEEAFGWEHPVVPDGVCFGPLPGPGDSDGGPAW